MRPQNTTRTCCETTTLYGAPQPPLNSGDRCRRAGGLGWDFALADVENPPNLPPCKASLPSWLRFSCFSPTSINTLVTFQVFLFCTMMLVSLLLFFWSYIPSVWRREASRQDEALHTSDAKQTRIYVFLKLPETKDAVVARYVEPFLMWFSRQLL